MASLVYGGALTTFSVLDITLLSTKPCCRKFNVQAIYQYLKGKPEKDSLLGTVVTGSIGFQLKEGKFRLDSRKEFFAVRGVEMLEQVVQGGCGCPNPGNVQGQMGLNNLI